MNGPQLDALVSMALVLGLRPEEIATVLPPDLAPPPWFRGLLGASREARAELLAPRLFRIRNVISEAGRWP